jgi:hypothetical protein
MARFARVFGRWGCREHGELFDVEGKMFFDRIYGIRRIDGIFLVWSWKAKKGRRGGQEGVVSLL